MTCLRCGQPADAEVCDDCALDKEALRTYRRWVEVKAYRCPFCGQIFMHKLGICPGCREEIKP